MLIFVYFIIPEYSRAQTFQTFEDKHLQVVFSFTNDIDSLYLLYSVNLYDSTEAFAFSDWPHVYYEGEKDSNCLPLYRYYHQSVTPELKQAYGIFCSLFNPQEDSIASDRLRTKVSFAFTDCMYIEDTNGDSSKRTFLQHKPDGGYEVYIAFDLEASGIFAYGQSSDELFGCLGRSFPQQSYYSTQTRAILPSIFLGSIKKYSKLSIEMAKALRLKHIDKDKIVFFQHDH